MFYLMTNHINIIIIILLTIKIIPPRAEHINGNAGSYGNFTAIEFLKELKHSKPTYESILIMQNQNATISSNFDAHLTKVLHVENNNAAASNNSQRGFSVLSVMPTTVLVRSLMDRLQVPVLQLNELQSFYLKRQYSEYFLSIVFIDISIEGIQMTLNDHKVLLDKLSRNLLHMTTSKVMFLLNFPVLVKTDGDVFAAAAAAKIDKVVIESILVELFQHCWQQKIINVVALLADYQITGEFYSYNHFPEFQLELKSIGLDGNERQEFYPQRLDNLKGYSVSIDRGNHNSHVIHYKTPKGGHIFGGFVGHFIHAFAKKYNASLVERFRFKSEKFFFDQDLINLVKNGTLDISLGIYAQQELTVGTSYPIYLANWCIMLPIEPNIPSYSFFTSVFKGETYLLVISSIILLSMLLSVALYIHGHSAAFFDLFCHDNCLRGILGQPFPEISNPPFLIRFIYLKICILGILLTTSYLSYFSTYVTHPPKQPFLKTMDDILKSDLKVVLWKQRYENLMQIPGYKQYSTIFRTVKTYEEFTDLRNAFNTKYGYGVPNLQWDIINEQQKLFTAPLFRRPQDLCIISTAPMVFPIHKNSIFKSIINNLILECAQTGLLYKWISWEYFELNAAKELKLIDLGTKAEYRAMKIDDLRYVLLYLAIMSLLAILVFLAEFVAFYRRKIFLFYKNKTRK